MGRWMVPRVKVPPLPLVEEELAREDPQGNFKFF